MDEVSDSEFAGLLDAAQRGDGRGYEGLVRLVDRRLVGFARARGAEDPEATANEVMVKMCRSIGSFDGTQAQFRAWVFTIARRQLIDEHRKASRQVRSEVHPTDELPDAGEEMMLCSADQRERVETLIAHLTDAQREVILLRVVAGLSVEETATAMGKRPGAIRILQHRAIQELRSRVVRET